MIEDKMEIVDIPLEQWIARDIYQNCFPSFGSTNYPRSYHDMADYMNKHVHPDVTRGAIAQQIKQKPRTPFNELLYLNDHGQDHVKMVIERASELLIKSKAPITPYEAYIFLVAAHFHDVGTWLGRDGHEKKINEIMQLKEIRRHLPDDELVLKVIKRIAQAHGGHINGDKDTIHPVLSETKLNNCNIRKQFLAALLRFSDELADDRTRASRFVTTNDAGKSIIPEYSKIFHEYSYSLHTVDVNKNEINLKYYIPKSKVSKKYSKKFKDIKKIAHIYLFDEIQNRTMKMHKEKMYCMRFIAPGGIFIERINVTIEIVDDKCNETLREIAYQLKEKGYPNEEKDIIKLCPEMKGINGSWLSKKFGKKGRK